jgi:hypothetical protein
MTLVLDQQARDSQVRNADKALWIAARVRGTSDRLGAGFNLIVDGSRRTASEWEKQRDDNWFYYTHGFALGEPEKGRSQSSPSPRKISWNRGSTAIRS